MHSSLGNKSETPSQKKKKKKKKKVVMLIAVGLTHLRVYLKLWGLKTEVIAPLQG